jgi:transposase
MNETIATATTISGESTLEPTPELVDKSAEKPTIAAPVAEDLPPLFHTVAGLDVHKAQITVCVLGIGQDPKAFEIREFGTYKKNLRELSDWLLSHNVELAVMESTGILWRSPFHILQNSGLNVILANSRKVKNVPGHKTDIEDARWLAILARAGLVPSSRILPADLDELRELARLRQGRVEDMTRIKNQINKLLTKAGFNLSQVVTDVFGSTGLIAINGLLDGEAPETILNRIECSLGYRLKAPRERLLDALEGTMSELLRFSIDMELSLYHHNKKWIENVERELERKLIKLGHESKLDILETIPGVSRIAAMILLVELGCDITDFRSGKVLASWAGMCPGNNESAGKRRSGRTTPGNVYVKRILCEIACAAVRAKCYFKEKYRNLFCRRGRKRSIVAIGSKILQVAYRMLMNNDRYRDRLTEYEELVVKRNRSRWEKKIQAFDERQAKKTQSAATPVAPVTPV